MPGITPSTSPALPDRFPRIAVQPSRDAGYPPESRSTRQHGRRQGRQLQIKLRPLWFRGRPHVRVAAAHDDANELALFGLGSARTWLNWCTRAAHRQSWRALDPLARSIRDRIVLTERDAGLDDDSRANSLPALQLLAALGTTSTRCLTRGPAARHRISCARDRTGNRHARSASPVMTTWPACQELVGGWFDVSVWRLDQFDGGDPGGDVQAFHALDAQRLQRDCLIGSADQQIRTGANADRRAGGCADVRAGERPLL